MILHDGNKTDTSDSLSDEYIAINASGFQRSDTDSLMIRERGRRDYQILLISRGRCEAYHSGRRYSLGDGNILIYEPGERQEYRFFSGCESFFCHFSGKTVPELFRSVGLSGGVYPFLPNKRIAEDLSLIIQRVGHPRLSLYAHAALTDLIYTVAALSESESDSEGELLSVISYMNICYKDDITLDMIAERCGYSKGHISHLFKEKLGTPPMRYLSDIRLRRSEELLSATDMPISEISYSVGFSDPLYFSRIFKKRYGTSPSEYRSFAKAYESSRAGNISLDNPEEQGI